MPTLVTKKLMLGAGPRFSVALRPQPAAAQSEAAAPTITPVRKDDIFDKTTPRAREEHGSSRTRAAPEHCWPFAVRGVSARPEWDRTAPTSCVRRRPAHKLAKC